MQGQSSDQRRPNVPASLPPSFTASFFAGNTGNGARFHALQPIPRIRSMPTDGGAPFNHPTFLPHPANALPYLVVQPFHQIIAANSQQAMNLQPAPGHQLLSAAAAQQQTHQAALLNLPSYRQHLASRFPPAASFNGFAMVDLTSRQNTASLPPFHPPAAPAQQEAFERRKTEAIPVIDPSTQKEIALRPPSHLPFTASPMISVESGTMLRPSILQHQADPVLVSGDAAAVPAGSGDDANINTAPVIATQIFDRMPQSDAASDKSSASPQPAQDEFVEEHENPLMQQFIQLQSLKIKGEENDGVELSPRCPNEVEVTPMVSEQVTFGKSPDEEEQPALVPDDPFLQDLLYPPNVMTAFEPRESVVDETPEEWLPSTMQVSDDESELLEYMKEDELLCKKVSEDASAEPANPDATAAIVPPSSKQIPRSFIIACYNNPKTRQRPANMAQCSVVLDKPLEGLLDVLKKSMVPMTDSQGSSGKIRSFISRGDSRRNMFASSYHGSHASIQLHKSQDPYFVKATQELTSDEQKIRGFRSLMNKITAGNITTIIQRIRSLDLTKEVYHPVLEVIFDKAIQEPNFCHLYAQICNFLSKELRHNIGDESNKMRFRNILISRVQQTFLARLSSNESYDKKKQELEAAHSDVTKKRLKDELDEIARDIKRKYMGNMRLIGQLAKMNVLSDRIVDGCIRTLFNKQEGDWQYESLCNLLTVIGPSHDAQQSSFMDDIIAEMQRILPSISDPRVRFMFLDLFDLRQNRWQPKKPKDASDIIADNSRRVGQRGSIPNMQYRSSGGSRSMQKYDYQQQQMDDYYSKGRQQLNFDLPDKFDQRRDQFISGGHKPAKPKARPVQQPTAAADPVKTKDELTKLISSKAPIKSDELETQFRNLCAQLRDPSEFWKDTIRHFCAIAIEDESRASKFGHVLISIIKSNDLPHAFFVTETQSIFKYIDDTSLDVPNVHEYVGVMLSFLLHPKSSDLAALLQEILQPVAKTLTADLVVVKMLEYACKQYSNEHVKTVLDGLPFKIADLCSDEGARKLVEMKQLHALFTGEVYRKDVYEFLVACMKDSSLRNEHIDVQLEEILSTQGSADSVKILQPMIRALLDSSVDVDPTSKKASICRELFDERAQLLHQFIRGRPFELEAIRSICSFVESNQKPYGLLEELLNFSLCNGLLTNDTLQHWRSVEAKNLSGSLAMAVKRFFQLLDENNQSYQSLEEP